MKWPFQLSAWQRQGLALLPAALAAALTAFWLPDPPATRWLVGWIAYCATYVALVWHLAARVDAETTQRWAQREDPGALMLFMFVTAAACVSLVVVAINVGGTRSLEGGERGVRLALMALSLAGAWLLIQCVFTLHYARVYYRDGNNDADSLDLDRGLSFPDGRDPDYLDLLYHSMVVGMTSQVADVSVSSRPMRHLVLVHALLSLAFNLGVLATAVNVFASAGH